jgi:hypothetical protein
MLALEVRRRALRDGGVVENKARGNRVNSHDKSTLAI